MIIMIMIKQKQKKNLAIKKIKKIAKILKNANILKLKSARIKYNVKILTIRIV
jgi:hypothetical protein